MLVWDFPHHCTTLTLTVVVRLAYLEHPGPYSHRSGGRTAWSSTVTVEDWNCSARHWYDGQFIHNAREDAAEVMLTRLRNPAVYGAPRRQQSSSGGRHSAYGAR